MSTKKRNAAQRAQAAGLAAIRWEKKAEASSTISPTSSPRPKKPKTRKNALEEELNLRIQALQTTVSDLEAQLLDVSDKATRASSELAQAQAQVLRLEALVDEKTSDLATALQGLQATGLVLTGTGSDLKKAKKRVQRLSREKEAARKAQAEKARRLINENVKIFNDLEQFKKEAQEKVENLTACNGKLDVTLSEERKENALLRCKVRSLNVQRQRAQASLKDTRARLNSLTTWKATQNGVYTSEARRLTRALLKAGCAGDRVASALSACAKAFGVRTVRLPSRRTVARARDEGGYFGLLQSGREVRQSKGIGISSDGTTDRKTTFEGSHMSGNFPTYEDGVDDSDPSTWTNQTRFLKVEGAIDHKANTQFEGTKKIAEEMAAAYSNSPLAQRDGAKMEAEDFFRKQEFQNMDHASDGKKKLNLCIDHKRDIIAGDLGREALNFLETGEFQKSLSTLTKDDVEKAYQQAKFEVENESDIDRTTVTKLIERIVGEQVLEAMPEQDREMLLAITFAGCCAHKDMNAFKYGVAKMEAGWEERQKTPPVVLANKANAATIRTGDADSAAVQQAIESSSRGGVKLVSLAAALFNHSDDKRGYQEMHETYIQAEKLALHGIKDNSRFPDANNTRFNSHSQGACELITYLDSYVRLLESFRDSKTNPGFNHMESTVYKGIQDIGTITELAAISLYGISVSWLYMAMVRGKKGEVRNLLDADLIDLHRRLPAFCEEIAANPDLLLQENISDFSKLTLNGKPWSHPNTMLAIRILKDELPDLKGAITDMFSGAAEGWRQFTQEFVPGGPFDSLTPEQRARIFIPATNDANEGALGSWRVWRRYHPSSTARGFSNKTRLERNNTENFIKKHCNHEDQLYVMRAVRLQGASGESARFRQELLEAQRERIRAFREKQQASELKKLQEKERLISIGIIMDVEKIQKMKSSDLDDQLKIHKKILNDEVLAKTLQKDLKRKNEKLTALLAAVERNTPKVLALIQLVSNGNQAQFESNVQTCSTNDDVDSSRADIDDQDELDVDEDEFY